MKRILYGAVMISLLSCGQKSGFHQDLFGLADINHANRRLLEVAMEDGFPPPIASRVYGGEPASVGTVYEETRCRNREKQFLDWLETAGFPWDQFDWSFDPLHLNQGKNWKPE